MKKIVLLGLLVFLLAVLPVTAQTDELAGTWIGFSGPEFTIMRFSPDDGILSVINTFDGSYIDFSSPYQADGQKVIFEDSDGVPVEMPCSIENGKLHQDLFGAQIYTRIDDGFFPEDPESSPYIGEDRQYRIGMAEDGGILIFEYLGDEETVEVPSEIFGIPVTEIGDSSICYKEMMKHLILPEGIKAIGPRAFEENRELEDVSLPDSLESIGEGAFSYCYKLKEFIIPGNVKKIGDAAFWECTFLKRVVLPENLEEVWPESFYGAERLLFFVKEGSYAEQFCRDNGFKCVSVSGDRWGEIYRDGAVPEDLLPAPAGADLIGTWIAFYDGDFSILRFSSDGSDLSMVESCGYYPEVSSGGWEADGEMLIYYRGEGYAEEYPYSFADGKLFLDGFRDQGFTRIDDSYFPEDPEKSPYLGENKSYWISQLEDGTIQIDGYVGTDDTVVIPDSVFGFPVTSIRETAFMGHDGLKHVTIPHGVTFIGRQAFSDNDDLESVELPDTLQTLEYSAFQSCRSLKEIVIPEGVRYLESDTFWNCESLTKVTLPESLEGIDEDGVFDSTAMATIVFTVKPGSFAEQYCREHDLTCAAADGEPLTGGILPEADSADCPADEPAEGPAEEQAGEGNGDLSGEEALYNEAMALYNDEKYYSARQAFLESGYGNWEEMAEKCVQEWPSAGEIWRDRSQWLQDMELTITIDQPQDTGMFIRIFKDQAPVSYLFISGPDSVTVRLPGNGYYAIKDGIGYEWYGIKEAFGREGSYESMTFDEQGAETVYLKSNYAYTLSINVSSVDPDSDQVFSESEDWDSFIEAG